MVNQIESPRGETDGKWVAPTPYIFRPYTQDYRWGFDKYIGARFGEKYFYSDFATYRFSTHTPATFDELVGRQPGIEHLVLGAATYCISTAMIPLPHITTRAEMLRVGVSEDKLVNSRGNPIMRRESAHLTKIRAGREYIEKLIGPDIGHPNEQLSWTGQDSSQSSAAYEYLVYKLASDGMINPKTGSPFQTIDELSDFFPTEEHGIEKLEISFENLAQRERVAEMVEKGQLDPSKLDSFFLHLAAWNALAALNRTVHGYDRKTVFPFTPSLTDYDARYLPYLLSAVNQYMVRAVDLLKIGRVFPPGEVFGKLKQLKAISIDALTAQRHSLSKQEMAQIVGRVNHQLALITGTFQDIIRTGSYNKRIPEQDEVYQPLGVEEIRDLINPQKW